MGAVAAELKLAFGVGRGGRRRLPRGHVPARGPVPGHRTRLLFGYLSARWDTGSGGGGAVGLQRAFLVMLLSVLGAGLILIVFARRTYPRDVATATASHRSHQPPP